MSLERSAPLNSNSAVPELESRIGRLLPSQKLFVFDPAPLKVLAGGVGSGKSKSLCIAGLVLSAVIPANRGMIGRFHATDLEDSVLPLFFETCPPSWIKNWDKQRKILTLKNYSEIYFRHIHDSSAGAKSRRVGLNLGWFGIDQLEECEAAHWNALLGRLRLPRAKRRFALANLNPSGKDWIYRTFFDGLDESWTEQEFVKIMRNGSRLGIAIRSEENKKSNGGFVDDEYFESLREQNPSDWIARYMDCSFAEFAGKVYIEYHINSVHNLDPFPIPAHWNYVVGVDCGGAAPWAIGVHRVDEAGNMVQTDEFHRAGVVVSQIAAWLKENVPVNSSNVTLVIDWENRQAIMELAEHGIHCRPARKDLNPTIMRTKGYLHPNKKLVIPDWFVRSQPPEAVERLRKEGVPRWFVFRTCKATRRSLDEYVYDTNGKPKKENDHGADQVRYAIGMRPQASELRMVEAAKLVRLRQTDPLSAKSWEGLNRAHNRILRAQRGGMDMNEILQDGYVLETYRYDSEAENW